MNKFLLIITLIFSIGASAFAQTTKNNSEWKNFAPAGEEFSSEVPAPPAPKISAGASQLYAVVSEGTYYFVFSDSLQNSYQTKKVFEYASENQSAGKSRAVGNFVGEQFDFADAEGFYQTILIVKTKARSYVFQTVSETDNNPAVERFFAGLAFNKEFPEEAASPAAEVSPNVSENKADKNFGSGSGAGNGVGNGIGSGIGSGGESKNSDSATSNKQTAAFKVLTKPYPKYTDLARLYNVSGVVQLRITFLANGEVGTITPIKKLPFGLTDSAVNAARGIKFAPPLKDGIAESATKVLEYGFRIY